MAMAGSGLVPRPFFLRRRGKTAGGAQARGRGVGKLNCAPRTIYKRMRYTLPIPLCTLNGYACVNGDGLEPRLLMMIMIVWHEGSCCKTSTYA